jgi:hypothetical protein
MRASGARSYTDPRAWLRHDLPELAKGVGAVTGASGAGMGAGSYLTDTLAHGIDPSTAAWNAAARAISARNWANPPQPPSWWPQPPAEQRPPPPEPQPPSRLSVPWVPR